MSERSSRRMRGGFLAVAIGAVCFTTALAARPSPSAVLAVADAAMASDIDTVRSLLKQGVDVNEAQGDGMTALHWAALNGDAELAEMLLYAGANMRAATRLGGYTPLFLAAKRGSTPIVETLLGGGADANAAATTGTTPLMLAAASGNAGAVTLLLDHGADINAIEAVRGHTALMFAATSNRLEALDILLARGADPAMTTTSRDVAEMDREAREARRQRGDRIPGEPRPVAKPDSKAEGDASAQTGGGAEAKKPQERGAELNEDEQNDKDGGGANVLVKLFSWLPGVGGSEPPPQARRRRRAFGELVGHHGGLAPLHFAARQGHREVVEKLLTAGADLNQTSGDNTTPLLIATINGHFDLAKHLVDQGADVTIASEADATPLYAAVNCQWGPRSMYPQPKAQHQQSTSYLELMTAILDAGADVNARVNKKIWYTNFAFDLSGVDESGSTPFWRAAYASDVDAMRLLLSRGADPSIATKKPKERPPTGGGTRELEDVSGLPPVPVGGPALAPIHAATGAGYGEGFAANSHAYSPAGWMPALKYLVEEIGVDVNQPDHEGYTPLHHAATRGSNEMIEYLMSKGANVMALSRDGMTVADMANSPVQRVPPFLDTVALLVDLGATITPGKCVAC